MTVKAGPRVQGIMLKIKSSNINPPCNYTGAYAAAYEFLIRYYLSQHVEWRRGSIFDNCIKARAREIATDAADFANI